MANLVDLRTLPSERGRRRAVIAASCCCTCCCCVHSLGGIVGAAIATRKLRRAAPVPGLPGDDEARLKRHWALYPVSVYWKSCGAALALSVVVYYFAMNESMRPGDWGCMLQAAGIMFLPIVQLAGGFIAILWVTVSSHPDRSSARHAIWKLIGISFLGALIGLVVTLPILGSFGVFR